MNKKALKKAYKKAWKDWYLHDDFWKDKKESKRREKTLRMYAKKLGKNKLSRKI